VKKKRQGLCILFPEELATIRAKRRDGPVKGMARGKQEKRRKKDRPSGTASHHAKRRERTLSFHHKTKKKNKELSGRRTAREGGREENGKQDIEYGSIQELNNIVTALGPEDGRKGSNTLRVSFYRTDACL